eukprot:PhM_4_TR407/c0_g1_i2/m.76068
MTTTPVADDVALAQAKALAVRRSNAGWCASSDTTFLKQLIISATTDPDVCQNAEKKAEVVESVRAQFAAMRTKLKLARAQFEESERTAHVPPPPTSVVVVVDDENDVSDNVRAALDEFAAGAAKKSTTTTTMTSKDVAALERHVDQLEKDQAQLKKRIGREERLSFHLSYAAAEASVLNAAAMPSS